MWVDCEYKCADALKTLGILLFTDFELLDVFGPLEMFASLPDYFNILLISENKGLIKSAQGISIETNIDLDSAPVLDLLLIPGGLGVRREVYNRRLLDWIKKRFKEIEILLSVCTGSALLAKTGLLNDRRATSNKIAFDWVKEQGQKVQWVNRARWVDDGNIVTSSGIAAGTDMALYIIARLLGIDKAYYVTNKTEYIWNQDPTNDPFSK